MRTEVRMPQTVTPVDPGLPTVRAVPVPPDLLRPMTDPVAELDRQVAVHITLGAAALAGLSPEQLRDAVAPLRRMLPDVVGRESGATDPTDHVPFALVLDVDPNDAVPRHMAGTRRGVSVISRIEAAAYQGVEGLEVPGGPAYLLVDIDTGPAVRGVRPEDAAELRPGVDVDEQVGRSAGHLEPLDPLVGRRFDPADHAHPSSGPAPHGRDGVVRVDVQDERERHVVRRAAAPDAA